MRSDSKRPCRAADDFELISARLRAIRDEGRGKSTGIARESGPAECEKAPLSDELITDGADHFVIRRRS